MRSALKGVLAAICVMTATVVIAQDGYEFVPKSFDGIGKAYMGREIAQVMSYQGAPWLERPNREQQERTDILVNLLNIKSTDYIADIGAGSGYFSFRMAKLAPKGYVFAVDVQEEMLALIKDKIATGEGDNVIPVHGSTASPKLKESTIDLMLLVDVYHEFSMPREMGLAMLKALKPGGRLALVEYRAEDPTVPIKELHKMTEAQARLEMDAVGFEWVSTDSMSLPWQHLMIFKKPESM
jgi:ubiquinone/menaquinone biosynthesis C-methylase UbiE